MKVCALHEGPSCGQVCQFSPITFNGQDEMEQKAMVVV